jgi:hypothetical protein
MEERESIETTRWIRVEVRCGCYFSPAETLSLYTREADRKRLAIEAMHKLAGNEN